MNCKSLVWQCLSGHSSAAALLFGSRWSFQSIESLTCKALACNTAYSVIQVLSQFVGFSWLASELSVHRCILLPKICIGFSAHWALLLIGPLQLSWCCYSRSLLNLQVLLMTVLRNFQLSQNCCLSLAAISTNTVAAFISVSAIAFVMVLCSTNACLDQINSHWSFQHVESLTCKTLVCNTYGSVI